MPHHNDTCIFNLLDMSATSPVIPVFLFIDDSDNTLSSLVPILDAAKRFFKKKILIVRIHTV